MTPVLPQDLPARRPVWEALSELFLDTDVSDGRAWRAQVLAESPYTLDELQAILQDEVGPVCQSNLLGVAGVWTGFDPQWLEAAILARASSPWRRLRLDRLGTWLLGQPEAWEATKAAVVARRGAGAHTN